MSDNKNKELNNASLSSSASNGRGGLAIYWNAFKTFFKIGAFTLGGGYAMISIIESEVVDKQKWISIFIGYKLRKTPGALCTSLGTALPSFLIILFIALFFHQFMDIAWVAAMFRGIRPAVVALIAVPTFTLAKNAKINLANCWIPIVTALLIAYLGVNPIYVLIAAAAGGYLYGKFIVPTE